MTALTVISGLLVCVVVVQVIIGYRRERAHDEAIATLLHSQETERQTLITRIQRPDLVPVRPRPRAVKPEGERPTPHPTERVGVALPLRDEPLEADGG